MSTNKNINMIMLCDRMCFYILNTVTSMALLAWNKARRVTWGLPPSIKLESHHIPFTVLVRRKTQHNTWFLKKRINYHIRQINNKRRFELTQDFKFTGSEGCSVLISCRALIHSLVITCLHVIYCQGISVYLYLSYNIIKSLKDLSEAKV